MAEDEPAGCFELLTGGLQTTVQDLGRTGLLATGMPPSGAFDPLSLQLANLLVGNDPGDRFLVGGNPGAAGLEMLLIGPELRILRDTVIAVTGAYMSPTLNGEEFPQWEAVRVRAGDRVAFPRARKGARAYLAVAGGIDVPAVLGSRSTNLRARIGGIGGRKGEPGDTIAAGAQPRPLDELDGRRLATDAVPALSPPWELRVVLGPQDELFLPESVQTFLTTDWRLSSTSDRMGCRFVGPKLDFKPRADYLVEQAGSDPSNIVDDTIPVGGIQVPSGVEPIVLGVDGPSLGGYAKIATMISSDLSRLAQVLPGNVVRFSAVSVERSVKMAMETNSLVREESLR